MSTTVRSQPELDAALADLAVTHIIIDSPAGVRLSLITERQDVETSIIGESNVGPVRGSATVSGVWGSATVRDVGDSATVRGVGDSATVRDVGDSATVRGVRGSATVSGVWGSATVSGVWGSATVRDVGGSATVSGVWGSATVRGVRDSATVRDVGDSATVSDVWGSATVRGVWGGCAIVGVRDRARILDVGPHVSVHLHSAQATVGGGVIIDLTALDMADPATWIEYHGLRVDSEADLLRAPEVSSRGHRATLSRDGLIVCGCWSGSLIEWREMAESTDWPSWCGSDTCDRYRPRLLAWADLCEQQLVAWATSDGEAL